MSENIAGYIDRSYIKGQYYKYAASPKPTVSTANFDTDMEDLLAKAVFVTRGQTAGGTFPNDTDINFLFTTLEYGNNSYLQIAYSVPMNNSATSGCEYRRIYLAGTWSTWYKFDSDVSSISGNVSSLTGRVGILENSTESDKPGIPYAVSIANDAKETADTAAQTANGMAGSISQINGKIDSLQLSLSPLIGSKMALVTKTVSSAGLTLTGQWCISGELSVDISDKGFTKVTNIIIGQATNPNFPAIVYLTGFNTTTIKYHYGSYAQGTVKNRTDTFLVIGE